MEQRLAKLEGIWQRPLTPMPSDVASFDVARLIAEERTELEALASRGHPTPDDPRGLAGFSDAELERLITLGQHAGAYPACSQDREPCWCFGSYLPRVA